MINCNFRMQQYIESLQTIPDSTYLYNEHELNAQIALPNNPLDRNYIINYERELISIEDIDNVSYQVLDEPSSIKLSKSFNNYFMHCFVLKTNITSWCSPNESMHYFSYIQYNLELALLLMHNKNVPMLFIIENANINGLHTHILFYLNKPLTSAEEKKIIEYFNHSVQLNGEIRGHLQHIVSSQKINSNASYINYLKKKPHQFVASISNDIELSFMYMNFDRTHIFDKESVPKFGNKNQPTCSNMAKPVVKFIMHHLHNNVTEFQDLMTQKDIDQYLHITNLKQIFHNCFLNFSATLTQTKQLGIILDKFLDLPKIKKCYRPIREWIEYQNIDWEVFVNSFGEWLIMENNKMNSLMFIGTANTGKSHIARSLWRQFCLNRRFQQDGLFTFANAVNAGCIIWEEPYISPELADTAKLILEGSPDVEVAIKNNPTAKLGKRIPIIITSNHELYQYVGQDRQAFNARTYKFQCSNVITSEYFCNAEAHVCYGIGGSDSTVEESTNEESICDTRRRSSKRTREICEKNHAIEDNHAISFIAYVLDLIFKQTIGLLDNTLVEKLNHTNFSLCGCSEEND